MYCSDNFLKSKTHIKIIKAEKTEIAKRKNNLILQFQKAKLVSFTILATLLKLTSDVILHYLRSADLSESFSELIVSTFIFHNIFSIDFIYPVEKAFHS